MNPTASADARWTRAITAALLVVTLLPYAWARLTRPPGTEFGWALGFLPDTLGNAAFTRQAADGAWLFADPFTAEPHPARFFNPLFLVQGWLQRLTGLGPGPVFQLSRLAAAVLLIVALTRLIAPLFAGAAERRLALLFVCCSGGLGFLAPWIPACGAAADINGAEMTTFFSMYQQAHFTAALALIAIMACALPVALATGSWKAAVAAGAAHLALDAVHPYDAPVPLAAAAVLALVRRWRGLRVAPGPLLLFALFPAPVLGWNAWQAAFVPVYRDFAREGLLAPPWPVTDYLLGWGLLLPLAALGVRHILKARDERWLFPLAWLAVVPVLMLLPLPARRKLMEGFHIFLALVAARGALSLREALGARWRRTGSAGLLVLSLSGVYVMARDLYAVAVSRRPARPLIRLRDGALDFPFHGRADRWFAGTGWMGGIFIRDADRYDLPDDLLRVFRATPKVLAPGTVVLAAPSTGLFLPMFTPQRVVAGHLFGTLRMTDKELSIRAVMDARLPDAARRELIGTVLGARAILFDDRLAALGGWRPGRERWLAEIAGAGTVRLYAAAPAPSLSAMQHAMVRAEIDAGYMKEQGRLWLEQGAGQTAIRPLVQAAQLRPDDPEIRALLSAARKR